MSTSGFPSSASDEEKRALLRAMLAARSGASNVTADQRRLWTLLELDEGVPAERRAAYELAGPLDIAVLQQALVDVATRCDLLRSTFKDNGGAPLRIASARSSLELAVSEPATDAAPGPSPAAQLGEAWVRFEADGGAAADRRGPLARLTLVRCAADRHLLLISMHELIADAASPALLAAELLASYRALGDGSPAPAPQGGFVTFVQHEQRHLASARAEQAAAAAAVRLADVPPLAFPVGRPRPPVKTHRSASATAALPAERVVALEALARARGGELHDALLTGFAALLSRLTAQASYAIGVCADRRRGQVWARTLGPIDSATPVRIELGGASSFAEALRRTVLAMGTAATAGDALPFAALVEAIAPPRDLSRTPLYQVAFELTAAEDLSAGELVARPRPVLAARTAVDLTLAASHFGDELHLRLDYNTDLCDDATAARLLRQLGTLLAAAVAEPSRPLPRLPLLSDDERAQLQRWNATSTSYPADRTLHAWVAEQAWRTPSATAVRCGDEALTFAELQRRAAQLARHLRSFGLPLEGIVGICLERSLHLPVAILAVLTAGGAYLPLDPELPPLRLQVLLADSGARLLLTTAELAERLPASSAHRVLLDADWPQIARHSADPPDDAVRPDNLAYLIYTSGSTGAPKAVMVSHRSVVNNVAWRQRTWPLSSEDRVLNNHSFSFDPSVWATFWPLVSGAELVITPPRAAQDIKAIVELIRRHRITVYGAVPSFHALVMEAAPGKLDSLRYVLSGGEALGESVQRAVFEKTSATLANLYGPTEATIDATMWTCPRGEPPLPALIGAPIANLTAHVLDDHLEPAPPGIAGELYLSGLGVARGYHGQPQLTAARFVPDPFAAEPGARMYRTGDLALRSGDGALSFLGRIDDQVKIRGFRIELGEIEAVLTEHPDVREAAVLAVGTPGEGRRLAGYVVAHPGVSLSAERLLVHLAERLPVHMVPWRIVMLPALPKSATGKLDRAALPALDDEPRSSTEHVAPRNRLEEEIAETFALVLGCKVGIHDDFFEAGGTSMMLARTAIRLVSLFQMEIPVHQFFRIPTIAGVAAVVELYRREGLEAVMAQQHAEHLEADATLAPEIRPDGLPVADVRNPRAVLLTGATGYLGAFLLEQLLERTSARVFCLVRAPDEAQALARLRSSMTTYRIWKDAYLPRITPLLGDLAKLRFGLSSDTWDELGHQLDAIYHSGALVNFVYPYSALRAANVRGTEEVLRLACTHKLKSVHYVSTIDVLLAMHSPRPFIEDDTPLRSQVEVPAGYTGSKWVAEKVANLAQQRGIPVSIYRPGLILSHEETGATQTNDYLLVAFRGFVPMGLLPSYPRIFDAVPVDYVAKAIVYISTQPEAHGKFFHLFNPAPVSLDRFYDWIRSYGYRFDVVDFDVARRRALEVEADHPLYPLVPLIRDAEAMPQESLDPAFIDRLQPDLECRQTMALLQGSGVRCPPMTEALAHSCLRYLIDVGFLPPPEAIAATAAP